MPSKLTTKMKNFLLFSAIVLLQLSLSAQTEKMVESTIKDVTVYQQGVQISRIGKCNLTKGKTTLVFSGLSSKIDPKSIQAKATNDMMIVSVTHSIDYLNKNKASKEIENLEKSRKNISDSIKVLKNIKVVYNQEKEMILTNKSIGGNNGVNINDLQNAANFFRNRLTEIETKSHQLDTKMYQLKVNMISISKQLLELNSQVDLPTSQVKVIVSSEKNSDCSIMLDYIIGEAGWSPNYDIRIKDIDSPLSLTYKAKVYQNTGEDWNDVNLTLSTGNPSVSNYKPFLDPYYLTFNNYYTARKPTDYSAIRPVNGAITGVITDADSNEPIPGVSIVVKGTTQGTVSDIDGKYQLTLPNVRSTIAVSFIGYNNQELNVSPGVVNVALKQSQVELEEVVVTAYGEKSDDYNFTGVIRGASSLPKKKEQVPLAIQKRETSTEFKIEIPYSIPSDNKEYDVSMVEYEVPAQYNFSAVPKLSTDAFLMARIPEWTKYNMLNGYANLFFKGIFQGETYLDLNSIEDTLQLSIGRDKDIVIQREIQKDFTSKSFISNYTKELKTWNITIKNNKDNPIAITIEDQFPISKNDEIKVEQLEQTGAKLDKDNGKLTWDLNLAAKEKKVLTIKYSVKYPKGSKIIVE